jgi:hypothetical protein
MAWTAAGMIFLSSRAPAKAGIQYSVSWRQRQSGAAGGSSASRYGCDGPTGCGGVDLLLQNQPATLFRVTGAAPTFLTADAGPGPLAGLTAVKAVPIPNDDDAPAPYGRMDQAEGRL